MKKVKLSGYSDDCSNVVVDGKRVSESEYTDKTVKIGDIEARLVYDGAWNVIMSVPDDMPIEVIEEEEDWD
jgi:hypothetical protein